MDVTPTTPQKRPTRAPKESPKESSKESKQSAAKAAAASPNPAIKAARRRKAAAPESDAVSTAASPQVADIGERIATTAYFLAAARNFEPGHELEDWLEAERRERAAD